MRKRIIGRAAAVFLAFALVLTVLPISAQAGTGSGGNVVYDYTGMKNWPQAPEITAASAYMIELNTGAVLFDKDGDRMSHPASTTKIMTALLALENCNLDDIVTFSHNAVYDIEEGGNHWEFQEGEELTVEECIQFLLVESVNECGYALAEHIAGSVEAFADMMNKRAAELGATGTHFTNPHGLNDEDHYTSAKDMAMILWGCVRNQRFQSYASLPSVKLYGHKIQTDGFSRYTNHHKMLLPDSEYYYPAVVCGKTGYTSICGNTLVTYARKDGMDVVCVLMRGGSDRFNDCAKLLNYAFDNFTVKKTEDVLNSKKAASGLSLGLKEEALTGDYLLLPNDADWDKVEFSFTAGDGADGIVGSRTWTYGKQTLAVENVGLKNMGMNILSAQAETAAEGSAAAGESGAAESKAAGESAGAETAATAQADGQAAQEAVTTQADGQVPAESQKETAAEEAGGAKSDEGAAIFGFTLAELGFLGLLALLFIVLLIVLIKVIAGSRGSRRRRRRRRRNKNRRSERDYSEYRSSRRDRRDDFR